MFRELVSRETLTYAGSGCQAGEDVVRAGTRTPAAILDEGRTVEPERISAHPPATAAGNWIRRGCRAFFRERRFPTRAAIALDRFWIAIGCRLKAIRADGLNIQVRRLTSDEHFVREVIINREYNPSGFEIQDADVIVDIGGNVGSFTLLAAKQAPHGTVITLEPVGDSFRLLQKNLVRNRCSNVIPLRAALLAENRRAVIYLSPQGTGRHSVYPELAAETERCEHVDGIDLEELFRRYHVTRCHFLKLDCEGAEFEVIERLSPELAERIDKLVIEYHTLSTESKRTQADRLIESLQQLGFRVVRYTDVVGTYWGMIYAKRR